MTLRILGINGSLRTGSPADYALRIARQCLEERGTTFESFELNALPALDGRPDDQYPAAVVAWRAAAEAADGYLIAVPSFHGGMPGALKNALDFLDMEQVGGKPFAIIGVSWGDAEPGVTDTMRTMRHLGGIAAVPDVVISRARDHWGTGEQPANKGVLIAIDKIASDLFDVCTLRAEDRLPAP